MKCQCSEPGYCKIHKRNMTTPLVKVCQTSDEYFGAFQVDLKRQGKIAGLGDFVAKALSSLGVKKKQGCGCAKRQEKLNQMFPFE